MKSFPYSRSLQDTLFVNPNHLIIVGIECNELLSLSEKTCIQTDSYRRVGRVCTQEGLAPYGRHPPFVYSSQ